MTPGREATPDFSGVSSNYKATTATPHSNESNSQCGASVPRIDADHIATAKARIEAATHYLAGALIDGTCPMVFAAESATVLNDAALRDLAVTS